MVLAIRSELRNHDDLLRRVSQQDDGENATERLSAGVIVVSPSRNLPRRWNVVRFGFGLDHHEYQHQHQIQRRFQQSLLEQQE